MRVRVLREKKRVWAVLALVFAFAVVLVGTTTYARAEEDATLLDESNMGEVMEEITESNDEAMALDGLDSNVDTDGANGEFTEDEAAIPEQPSLEVVTDDITVVPEESAGGENLDVEVQSVGLDNAGEAMAIDVNTWISGSTLKSYDDDWYRFTTPADGYVSLSFDNDYHASSGWYVYLYKPGATSYYTDWWFEARSLDGVRDTCRIGLPAGTYYVKVDGRSAGLVYRLKVNFAQSSVWEREASNDTPNTATPMALDTTYYGTSCDSSDDDWWTVTVSQTGTYRLIFDHDYDTSSGWYVYLYDSSATSYYTNWWFSASQKGSASQYVTLAKGTYYLKVDGRDTSKTYRMMLVSPNNVMEAKVSSITVKTYTGKVIKPSPTVRLNGKKLRKGTDYTLSYAANTNVGTASVTIAGKGKYKGTKTVHFKIRPKGTSVKKLSRSRKALTVKWAKQATQTTGYQVQYSKKKSFSGAKRVTVKGSAKTSKKLKGLKAKQTYYVRVRTYKKVGGKTYVSTWSDAKKAKTK